jgi:FkbM family methyltransferase
MSFVEHIQTIVKAFGFELRATKHEPEIGAYHSAVLAACAQANRLHLVVVGANDGMINDPIYDLIKVHLARKTTAVLIEPNSQLHEQLMANYSFLDRKQILGSAVGKPGKLTLFTVKREFWGHFKPSYAADWPPYRAATGITSGNRDHVLRALRRHLDKRIRAENAIAEVTVDCSDLPCLLRATDVGDKVDVLQIDTEGLDDEVIYNSNLAKLQPRIVRYEECNLSIERRARLREHLSKNGYRVFSLGPDCLAIVD